MFGLGKKRGEPFISAVIVAAGEGNRMEGIDKQTSLIDDLPVVVRSIAAFEACPRISEIVLVCREERLADFYALVQEYGPYKVTSVVSGGAQRQDSVFRGIEACSGQAEYFAIHDGARPLVTQDVIEDCLDLAIEHGAAAAGVRCKDTIKLLDAQGRILSTPDRERTYCVQTPQIFAAGLYRRAMERAKREGARYTDDCQLVEREGERVYISPGSYENIKITTPEDLALADAVLAYREEGPERWQTLE